MSIRINKETCNGCGQCQESECMKVCPGNLLYKNENNKAEIRSHADCWDCASCVKECPRSAIEMYLPYEIGGRGSTLTAQDKGAEIVWTLQQKNGTTKQFKIRNKLFFNSNI
jgi:adenylylsulfate reductase subunit B